MPTNTPLSLFVSSKMQELADERRAIQAALSDKHMFSWLWEDDAGARPEPIRHTCLKEVEACDIYIGLFWLGYGQYTVEEYEHARRHKKPCLVYEKRIDIERRIAELLAFLKHIQQVENDEGLTVRWFMTPEQLAAFVQEDVMHLLTTTFRESRRQPALASSSGLYWLKPPRQILDKNFVGRQQQVDELLQELSAGESVAITGRPTAQALQGMAGIGKTYLALKLAIDLYDHFPAGVIRIDLGQQIKTEADVQPALSKLASWVFNGLAPPGPLEPEQVAAWLTETAPGRLLVLFDDAWHRAPLQTLNRALPANAVRLVTTRSANVAQSLGGKTVQLERLSPADGLALLEDRLHCHGDITHRADLKNLVTLLGGHALALDIAAARIKTPMRISTILHSLQKGIGHGVLDGLKFSEDDERDTNLEKSLALSYDLMTPEQQHRFRTLSVFVPEAPILPEAVAAVWGMQDIDTVQESLFELVDLALLTSIEERPADIAYRQHSLLQIYASALSEKATELHNAHLVLARYYSDQFAQAGPVDNQRLIPHELNVLAALHWTADNEPSLFLQILSPAAQFLRVWGQSTVLETYLPPAIHVATALDDKIRQANLLQSLGDLERRLGNLDLAHAHYDAALPLYHLERNRLGEAYVYQSLGYLFSSQKDWQQAKTFHEQALTLHRAERNPLGQAGTLYDLGHARFELGERDQGMQDVQQAAQLFRFVQDEEWAGYAEQRLTEMQKHIGED